MSVGFIIKEDAFKIEKSSSWERSSQVCCVLETLILYSQVQLVIPLTIANDTGKASIDSLCLSNLPLGIGLHQV